MKKVSYVVILLLLSFTGTVSAQLQRMAILPAAMHAGGVATSLCLDLFRDIPKSGASYHVIEGEAIEGRILGTGDYRYMGASGAKNSGVSIVSNGAESISREHYQFVKNRINKFSHRTFDALAHQELQNEVWSYGALKHMGYIKEGNGMPVTNFDDGIRKFCRDFDIHATGADQYEAVVLQAEQWHAVRKMSGLTSAEVETIIANETVTVMGNTARVNFGGEHFDVQINYINIAAYTSQTARSDVNAYLRMYHKLPTDVNIKYYSRLMYVKTEDGKKVLKLNMPLLRSTKVFRMQRIDVLPNNLQFA